MIGRYEDRNHGAWEMVHGALWPTWTKGLGAQYAQSHVWARAAVGTCGDDLRPSKDEIAVLACAMLDSMYERLSIHKQRPRRESNIFPVIQLLIRGFSRAS